MATEEMPPQWMWSFADELEIWFESVDVKRKERYGAGSSSNDDDDSPMLSNELAKGRR